ncbi:hypothetical protein DASC09_019620 [Saccharomycopsis crataegensis]|uniref:BZIP domain-containing protein n=1 Tax=Saccharomycopsis crataegensis TaxID=43959 RepID=A0AAV5QJ43_9ASCO|nr:hypothetical protein DASC09_019620 [Saccharomycopsis crataegensis]
MMDSLKLSTASVLADHKVTKPKPGRKLSQEPAKSKRNEQVRNAQRKYRAKNKQRMEFLELENVRLAQRISYLEEQLKISTSTTTTTAAAAAAAAATATSANKYPSPQTTISAPQSAGSDTAFDYDVSKLSSTDLAAGLPIEMFSYDSSSSVPMDTDNSNVDQLIDELYTIIEKEQVDEPTAGSVASIGQSASNEELKFVFYNKSTPATTTSSVDFSKVDSTSASQTHQFINTANCRSASNNTQIKTEPFDIQNLDEFISGLNPNNQVISHDMKKIFAEFMKDGVSIEEIFCEGNDENSNNMNNNSSIEDFLNSNHEEYYNNYDRKNNFNFDGGNDNEYDNENNNNNNNNNDEQTFNVCGMINSQTCSLTNDDNDSNECDDFDDITVFRKSYSKSQSSKGKRQLTKGKKSIKTEIILRQLLVNYVDVTVKSLFKKTDHSSCHPSPEAINLS